MKILVVDDNVDSAESLALLLGLNGHDTQTAHDGSAAMAAAAEFRPDVVLLDLGLPKMDGLEVCRQLREKPWARDMKMIALTGWAQDRDRDETGQAGFDHHLVKPVDFEALVQTLKTLPEGRR